MKGKQFQKLIDKYRKGIANDSEKLLMDRWFELIGKDADQITWSEERKAAMEERLMQYTKQTQVRNLFPQWAKIAAAITLLAVASVVLWEYNDIDTLKTITLTESQKVILPDGSIIWMKPYSTLTYPERFEGDTRSIAFTGEALFEIAKDASHPFIIDCNDVRAKVVGTSFTINSNTEATEITVLTGKVSVTATEQPEEITLLPNERAAYIKTLKQLAKLNAVKEETQMVVRGTEYDMQFKATPFTDIVQRIEKKFDVTIELANEKMKSCLLTGDFTDQSLLSSLDQITESLGFTYKKEENRIIIKGKGCD